MNANQKDQLLQMKLERSGVKISEDDARVLRRAEITLRNWASLECGGGDNYASWCIERDERGRPYMVTYPHPQTGGPSRRKIADREAGALRRVADVCARNGLFFYRQPDPRGCALYVSREPIVEGDYMSRSVGCCVI